MKTIRLTSILLLGFCMLHIRHAYGQDKQARMDRDIDVFEKVVNELFRNETWSYSNNQQASGTYVPGYGVIMNVPPIHKSLGNYSYKWSNDIGEDIQVILKESRKNMRDAEKQMRIATEDMRRAENDMKEIRKEKKIVRKETEKGLEKGEKDGRKKKEKIIIIEDGDHDHGPGPHHEERIVHIAPPAHGAPVPPIPPVAPDAHGYHYEFTDNNVNVDSIMKKTRAEILEKMKQALERYGDLLTQLAPEEKVLMVYDRKAGSDGSSSFYSYTVNGKKQTSKAGNTRITAEAKKDDIDALRNGKINAKAFRERVRTELNEQANEDVLDYRIFSGILETVLGHSEETGFRVKGNVRYTSLPGFGVIYNARLRAPYEAMYTHDDDETPKPNPETLAKENEARYNQLGKMLKNTVLDYGRSLRTLKNDQFILLNFQMPARAGTPPSSISMKVKKETLTRYEKSEITREQALEGITVTRR